MRFKIADLDVHPFLRNWMGRYFGDCCGATEMLMLLTIVHVVNSYVDDLEMRPMQVVQKIRQIAQSSSRSQRVHTLKEFEFLLHGYNLEFYPNTAGRGARLVPTQTCRTIVEVVIRHEKAASTFRIGSPQAA
ncbi:hypothetical protein HFO09_08875 [Rhizobium laguerreae]|uniref:hypothetical protein n=1 Tax=Rhizobium laguerreae TaxID=1076926 RepID=UPI001C903F18|nr:hypothetical protein [Rhizobium laguerreae]MBY3255799.1 hypothetical protein [Rhizobium laguerreae]MBY3282838.1 hypothetical protein [Rhizobium laguerreae]MBY3289192.1 hypothetical protein [Rhizobium laguerreae]